MTFDELQKDWNSSRNHPPMEQLHTLAGKFAHQMIRRRRFQSFWLVHTLVWLTLITGLAIWLIAIGKASPAQEWGLFPLLVVPWGFAIYFLRRHLNPPAPVTRGGLPVLDSLSAALVSNRETQKHLKIVGVLYVIMIPPLVLMMHQLHAAGKISARDLNSMALFFGATLLICGVGIAARYFGRLLPQQKQLQELLQQFKQVK